MKAAAWFTVGALVGVGVAMRLRPEPASSCCRRVAAGARAEVGELGGVILGPVFQKAGDALGLWSHAGALLDAAGVEP